MLRVVVFMSVYTLLFLKLYVFTCCNKYSTTCNETGKKGVERECAHKHNVKELDYSGENKVDKKQVCYFQWFWRVRLVALSEFA